MHTEQEHIAIAVDWSQEFETHREWLHGVALRRLGDRALADDAVQDTLLSVLRRNGKPDNPKRMRAWLYSVITRRIAELLRRRYDDDRHMNAYSKAAEQQESEPVDDWIVRTEQSEQLGEAMRSLDERDREVLLLKYVEHMTYQQIGNALDMSERAVEYRLVCAKQRLRDELNAVWGDESE